MSSSLADDATSIWAVIPAAGIGKRMGSAIPKQYLQLHGKTILQLTIERVLSVQQVKGIVIALREDDEYWNNLNIDSSKPVLTVTGGEERVDSVINALNFLQNSKEDEDVWVLVHDAVRPCVTADDINELIQQTIGNVSGGLLATPVRDTMKRQDAQQNVETTVDREGLWHALTPQFFPLKVLLEILEKAQKEGVNVTDEASAMESEGFHPKLVSGSPGNIKITSPGDLALAEHFYNEQA